MAPANLVRLWLLAIPLRTGRARRWMRTGAGRMCWRRGDRLAVVDAGIGGDRILHDAARNITYGPSALGRFDRDVLAQAGVKYVVMLEGINDIGHPGGVAPISETVSADDMIAGFKQIIERAHEQGVKVIGATITPFNGSGEKEAKRLAVNEWIRTVGRSMAWSISIRRCGVLRAGANDGGL